MVDELVQYKNDTLNAYPFGEFGKGHAQPENLNISLPGRFPRGFLHPLLPSLPDKVLVISQSTEQMHDFYSGVSFK